MPSITISDALWEQLESRAYEQKTTPDILAQQILQQQVHETDFMDLQEVLQGSSAGILVQGSQSEMLLGNEAALEMLGLTWDHLVGRTSFDPAWHVIHEDGSDFPSETHPAVQAIETRQSIRDVIMGVYRPKHDDRIWLRVTAIPQLLADGSFKQVVVTFTDVTAQKRAEAELAKANAVLEQRVAQRTQELATTNEKLHESQRQLSLITENVRDLIIMHDLSGRYLYVSPSSKDILGYEQWELLGINPYDYFHPDDIAKIEPHHQFTADYGYNSTITYRFRTAWGNYVWLESRTSTIKDADSKPLNILTVSRDVTRRIRVEEALRKEQDLLYTIMNASPVGITVVDKTGQIIFANPRAQDILGISRSEITARTYDAPVWKATDYDGNPWPDEEQPFVQVIRTKQAVWDVRHAIETDEGQRIYLAINGMPILDDVGEVEKAVLTVEDYTERKHQQDQLQEAVEYHKQLNELKTRFITMVSHEFRTPMSIIMTSAAILRRKIGMLDADEMNRRLDRVERQVKRLNRLIDDVTFINRAERGLEPLPRSIPFPHFLTQLIDDYRIIAEDHVTIELELVTPDCEIIQDEALLSQVFTNVLSNAIKFSPEGGTIRVHYECDATSIIVTIEDEGIGIPFEAQANLFTPFYRAENVGNIPGTGLGLAIVMRSLDVLNGSITHTPLDPSGTRFTIRLPLVYQAALQPVIT